MASREAVARAGGGGRLTFRILGPLEVTLAGKPIAVGGPKKRALLAYLLLHHDTLVRLDSLVHALWADPPASATTIVRLYVSQLRRALAGGGRELLVTEPRGYTLRLGSA
jgi:DNA-binding SARP family transcriptional activator